MQRPFPDVDITFQVKTLHKAGFLAGLLKIIGETGALLGDIETLHLSKTHSIRDLTVAVFDVEHRKLIEEKIRSYEGAQLLSSRDVVFEKHLQGKVHTCRTKDVRSLHDLRYYYTPGVARVCKEIEKNPDAAYLYTNIGQNIAVISNGTRVLGLGDIGAVASMPVMEGKAMIYDQFIGLSATPILVDTKDLNEFVDVVCRIAPTFGGIHLEDIRVPDCFEIEEQLQKRLNKPVMHDDQHGTGTVCLAAILSALRITGKTPNKSIKVAQIGLGAAGFGISKLLVEFGLDVIGVDPSADAAERLTKIGGRMSVLDAAINEADVVVATTGKVGLIKPAMIRKGQIVFALSNPIPEITIDEALAAGAIFAADGTNVNNALAYPGLFKAALHCRTTQISAAMKIAAAQAISALSDKDELVPSIFHPEVHKAVFKAVCKACGVAV